MVLQDINVLLIALNEKGMGMSMKRIMTRVTAALSAAIIVAGMATGCSKENSDKEPTAAPSDITATAVPTGGGGINTNDTTATPLPTAKPEASPTSEPTPEVTAPADPSASEKPTAPAEPTKEAAADKITAEEAKKVLSSLITDTSYNISLNGDPVSIEGRRYYMFTVDKDGKVVEPAVIVDCQDSSVYYYNNDGHVTEFTRFPLDNTEKVDGENNETSEKNELIDKIAGLSNDILGLSRDFSTYETEMDQWTTVVQGKECYGVDVFDTQNGKRQLVGSYYVAADGSTVYKLDDDNNFIKIY